jgi:hypothetical protein
MMKILFEYYLGSYRFRIFVTPHKAYHGILTDREKVNFIYLEVIKTEYIDAVLDMFYEIFRRHYENPNP